MYIQLTTRCNMTCGHCCFSCTSVGRDMLQRTFEKIMTLCTEEYVTLGGGEPTLHKKFQSFLLTAIAECEGVHVITNGSVEKTSLLLAKLAKSEVIGAELSYDKFHNSDLVSTDVVDIFHELKKVRNTSSRLLARGRAKENDLSSLDECCCDDLFFSPTGHVFTCGCKAIKLGSVHDLDIQEKIAEYHTFVDYDSGICGKDLKSEWNSRSTSN